LRMCASPQSWTCGPVTGVEARSAAITAAAPRRNANGDTAIRLCRMPIRLATRVAAWACKIPSGSRPSGTPPSACADRGTDARKARPASRRSRQLAPSSRDGRSGPIATPAVLLAAVPPFPDHTAGAGCLPGHASGGVDRPTGRLYAAYQPRRVPLPCPRAQQERTLAGRTQSGQRSRRFAARQQYCV
jgi:hypothetical protein